MRWLSFFFFFDKKKDPKVDVPRSAFTSKENLKKIQSPEKKKNYSTNPQKQSRIVG